MTGAPEPLVGERVLLEPWDERRRDDFAALAADPRVMRFVGRGKPWSPSEADEAFERELAHWREHGFGWRGMVERRSGSWLGFVGLNYVPPGGGVPASEVEIGWWLVPSAWGRGYASEGAALVRDEAFERVGLERIVARCQVANAASRAVAERIGMTLAYETRGRYGERVAVYALARPPA